MVTSSARPCRHTCLSPARIPQIPWERHSCLSRQPTPLHLVTADMAAHQKISRISHPGYCPRRWCAVCGRTATSKQAAFVFCEGEPDCSNVCHASCLGARETYTCSETQQLRSEANIEDEVTYVDTAPPAPSNEDGDTATDAALPPSLPDVDDDAPSIEGGDTEHQAYMEMPKEELVAHALSLKQEVSRQNTVVQSLTLQRDWIIGQEPQLLEFLQLIQALKDAKDADGERSTRTMATTAIASSIDNAWARKCTSSPAARLWWDSDRPRGTPEGDARDARCAQSPLEC